MYSNITGIGRFIGIGQCECTVTEQHKHELLIHVINRNGKSKMTALVPKHNRIRHDSLIGNAYFMCHELGLQKVVPDPLGNWIVAF